MDITREEEKQQIIKEFQSREAGVAEVMELYSRVEAIYVAAAQVSEQGFTSTSNTTNPSR
jgi:hypothetical protein